MNHSNKWQTHCALFDSAWFYTTVLYTQLDPSTRCGFWMVNEWERMKLCNDENTLNLYFIFYNKINSSFSQQYSFLHIYHVDIHRLESRRINICKYYNERRTSVWCSLLVAVDAAEHKNQNEEERERERERVREWKGIISTRTTVTKMPRDILLQYWRCIRINVNHFWTLLLENGNYENENWFCLTENFMPFHLAKSLMRII